MEERKNTALVTGASSGIGLAISCELARRGYPLLMVSNEEKVAQEAQRLQTEYAVKTSSLCMDLAQRDSAQKLFEHCQANNFKIEILVNNAGIFFFKDVIDTQIQRIETILNLHIYTPAMLSRLFAERMVAENRKGYILNMSSISSRMMMPGITLYSSTKSFLRCFSRAMRNEVYDKGVGITTVSPGAVATSLYNLSARYLKLGLRLGIMVTPERLAKLAVKKMLKRKAEFIPGGLVNRPFIFLVEALPEALVRKCKKLVDKKLKN